MFGRPVQPTEALWVDSREVEVRVDGAEHGTQHHQHDQNYDAGRQHPVASIVVSRASDSCSRHREQLQQNTQGDSDVILFRIYAS